MAAMAAEDDAHEDEGGFWVAHTTEAYEAVRHTLELALPAERSLSELEVWKIDEKGEAPPIHRSQLVLECWVPAADLTGTNALYDVCQRGFDVGEDGLEITRERGVPRDGRAAARRARARAAA